MKRLWIVIVAVLMIGSAAAMGTVVVKDVTRLKEIQASIREQQAVERETQQGKEDLARRTEEAKRALEEIPDSLGARRGRRLMDLSFNIAKAEGILDQKASRAEKRLEQLEGEKHAVKSHLVRWSLILGLADFILVGGVVLLAWRFGPR